MASSSVSQESLDFDDDFDTMARRNRIRTHRGRIVPHRSGEREGGDFHGDRDGKEPLNADVGDGVDESPTRGAAARLKDKQRNRANHHKGKPGPKDKRKLREKRRSTGVVHLPSTESTGDSLDEDDDGNNLTQETKKNTVLNEGTGSHSHSHSVHHHHHHHHHGHHAYEARPAVGSFLPRGNKSPSDLEADLEDNQDYDSTVSHSETNLTLIGRSEQHSKTPKLPGPRAAHQASTAYSKFSPEASRAPPAPRYGVGYQAPSSDQDSRMPPPSSAVAKSSVSALVSKNTFHKDPDPRVQREPSSVSREAGVSRPVGFNAPKDSWKSERGFGAGLPSRVHEQEQESSEKGSNSNGSASSAGGSYYTSRFSFQSAQPFAAQHSGAATDNSGYLEKQLTKEKEENKKLQQQLEQKDKRIAELECIVTMLNRECDDLDVDNVKLQEENKALIRAMQQLSSNR